MREQFGRKIISFIGLWIMAFFIQGCGRIGEKSTGMTVIYASAAIFAILLLAAYGLMIRKKDPWFLLLFSSVVIVNVGYFSLAVSKTLDEALLANRIAYMGSVLLPLSMLMIILNVCRYRYPKWFPAILSACSLIVFFVAASPGYLDIYYKDVALRFVNGVTVLDKTYGPWHELYLIYLLSYFVVMIVAIANATVRKKAESGLYATILGGAVFVNIAVWFFEQIVRIEFEILSISYIICEFFILCLGAVMQEQETGHENENGPEVSRDVTPNDISLSEQNRLFAEGIASLTKTERRIYDFYVEGKSTKEVLQLLDISENTLKFHNKNIYGKLSVSSRKQLIEIAKEIR